MAWTALKRLVLLLFGVGLAFWVFRPPGYSPPTETGLGAAIGSLDGLSAEDRRVFSREGFTPLGRPRPGDWLAVFPEYGQTFDQFKASRLNRLQPPRTQIDLLPIWTFDLGRSPSLTALQEFTRAFFQTGVRLLPPADLVPGEFSPRINAQTQRTQFRTSPILEFLKTRVASDAFCVVGVTMQDLYPGPSWNFVFGEATLWERVGVFSFVRYDPAFFGGPREGDWQTLLLRRSCKVLAHETGHMFGLLHCVHFDCLMNGSNHLQESDSRPMHLCPVCLRKWQMGTGGDPRRHYTDLATFYRRVGFIADADWIDHRLAFIAGSAPTAPRARGDGSDPRAP